jgi:hypothetical protein
MSEINVCEHCSTPNAIQSLGKHLSTVPCTSCGQQMSIGGVAIRLHRRHLLRALGSALVGAGAYGKFADLGIHRPVRDRILMDRERRVTMVRDLPDIEDEFAKVFKLALRDVQSVSLGRRKYLRSQTGFHVDNLAAASALSGSLRLHQAFARGITDSEQDIAPEGDVILLGGPTSTLWTEIAWEFEGTDPRKKVRSANPILRLPYYGGSDETDATDRPAHAPAEVGWYMEGAGPIMTANWPLIYEDPMRKQKSYKYVSGGDTTVTVNGRVVQTIQDNFLLITRVPNILGRNFKTAAQLPPEKWPALIVFEGNHGPGTRGLELLLTEPKAATLTKLRMIVQDELFFQIVLRLGEFKKAANLGYHQFTVIDQIVDFVPLRFDVSVYVAAHERAAKRLGYW